MSAPPLISVIIVNWNGRAYLDGCLRSLLAQSYPRFEVLLVDNESTDGSVAYVRRHFPAVRVVEAGRNLGFAGGNTLALDFARGELLAFLNNDTVCDREWLAALVAAVAPADVAGATGKVYALDEPERAIFTLPLIGRHSARARWTADDYPVSDVHYLSGNNMLIKRAVIEAVGPLDPDYGAYFEETDWCARMIIAGYRLVYTPHAQIRHKQLGSTSLEANRYFMERNRIRFALKNFDPPYLALFVPLYLAGAARQFWRGTDDFGVRMRPIIARAIWWNLRHLPRTLRCRRRDLGRIRRRRSYNRSLPRPGPGRGGRPGRWRRLLGTP